MSANGERFVVMTFNVLRRNPNYHGVVRSVLAERPDVLALQELSPAAARYVGASLHDVLPHQALHPHEGIAGGGVLSRYPVLSEHSFALSRGGHICQHLTLDCPGRPLSFFNIHLVAPRIALPRYDCRRRDQEAVALCTRLEQVATPLVVVGDFNMTPGSLGYREMCARLRDAFREAGRGWGRTFPHMPRIGRLPVPLWLAPFPVIRIDYVFHSPEFRARDVHTGQGGGSDHLPVIAALASL